MAFIAFIQPPSQGFIRFYHIAVFNLNTLTSLVSDSLLTIITTFYFNYILEDTARYAGLLLAPAEGFSLRPRAFFPLRAKQKPYYAVLANFRPFLVSSSNRGNI